MDGAYCGDVGGRVTYGLFDLTGDGALDFVVAGNWDPTGLG